MGYGSVQAVELVFLLLMLFVVAFGVLARKLKIPYPIVLVIGGTLVGFIPGHPRVALNLDLVFYVILPLLLYAAAWETSWREFSYHLVSILLLALGLVTGWVVNWIERRIDDGPIEIAISILVPYVAYFTADALRASGVLAVVTCGLYLTRRSSEFFSPGVRLQAWAVWDALTYILNGLVFVLIGLQLPYVLAGIQGYSLGRLVLDGALFSGL